MKHIFIINPKAGAKDISTEVISELKKHDNIIDYQVYITKGVGDGYLFVNQCCLNDDQEMRFYSCGGDGTLNEVVNGAIGYDNVSVACYPSGSGNDFVKTFGNREDFLNLDRLIDGTSKKVDVLKVNDRYTLNICNFGFDAVVGDNMIKFKNKFKINGSSAYNLAAFYSVIKKMKYQCEIIVDGQKIHDGNMCLCALANGICYGGGFYCAPKAKVDDGLIDVCLVKKVTRFQFFKLIGVYKKGQHLEKPQLQKIITYLQGKNIEIKSKKEMIYSMDGEIARSNTISVEIHPQAINFIIPKELS